MKKLAWLAPFAFAPMIACGDDGGGGVDVDASTSLDANPGFPDASSPDAGPTTDAAPNPGFVMPSAVTAAAEDVDGTWTEVGAANWDCLGTADDVESPAEAVTVTGTVSPFSGMGTPEPVEGGEVSLFTSTDFFADSVATSDPIAGDGSYSIEVPAGVERVALRVDIDKYLPTFTLDQSFAADATAATVNLDAVQEQTAAPRSCSAARAPRGAASSPAR